MEHNDEIKQYVARDLLFTEVNKHIKNNNLDGIKGILKSSAFSILPKAEVEHSVFRSIYYEYDKYSNQDILKYLIFDYKIPEEVSIDLLQGDIDPIVKSMFQTRKLKEELTQDLPTTETNKKMPKI